MTQQHTAENSAHESATPSQDYQTGFADGCFCAALNIARNLLDLIPDETIAKVTELDSATVAQLRAELASADASSMLLKTPHGTTLVEPNFVKIIRAKNNVTQRKFAELLGVHEHTVSAWESADAPIRMKTATFEKLKTLTDF